MLFIFSINICNYYNPKMGNKQTQNGHDKQIREEVLQKREKRILQEKKWSKEVLKEKWIPNVPTKDAYNK